MSTEKLFWFSALFRFLNTNIKEKPIYDWGILAGTLLVPIVLTGFGAITTLQERSRAEQQERIAKQNADKDRQHQVMTAYLSQMTDLILDKKLLEPKTDPNTKTVARAITLTTARRLDPEGKGQLLKFLYEAKLVGRCPIENLQAKVPSDPTLPVQALTEEERKELCITPIFELETARLETASLGETPRPELIGMNLNESSLDGANLPGIKLLFASLIKANLKNTNLAEASFAGASLDGARLDGAYLQKAILSGATLAGANLQRANLQCANLKGADLRDADLGGAVLDNADLSEAKLGTLQAKGAKHPTSTSLRKAILTGTNLSQLKSLEKLDLQGAIFNETTVPPDGYSLAQLKSDLGMEPEASPLESLTDQKIICDKVVSPEKPPEADLASESKLTSPIDWLWRSSLLRLERANHS
ncbi:MAG: pentapeptide repeat-containing protein [Elainella sp.]